MICTEFHSSYCSFFTSGLVFLEQQHFRTKIATKMIGNKTTAAMMPYTSIIARSYHAKYRDPRRRCFAPLCLKLNSVQYTALSNGFCGWSRISVDSLSAVAEYLH